MEKLVYMLRTAADRDGSELRKTLLEDVARGIREGGGLEISCNVNDEHVAMGDGVAIRQMDPPVRAMVSFWMQNSDDRADAEAAIAAACEASAGYLTVESRPLPHSPPKGDRAPGANLVTCITRKPDIDFERFIELWNHEHRKVALEIQSTTSYVRNAVVRPLTKAAPAFDGIVEESFPIEALTNPQVWYDCDDEAEYLRRVKRMVASVTAFLDLSVIESVPMSEYYLG